MSCFSQVGKIKDLLLEYDEDTLSNSGFALLEYEFTESGRKARETFTGRRIGDQFIEVEILEADPVNSQLESVKFEKREEYKTREKVNLFQTQI
jgi:RNA recognition motif-containing protein